MKIQTFSVLVGGTACNCECPRCVSKMTPKLGMKEAEQEVNWRNFYKGCRFARDCGVSTILLTGKGEPTIYPDLISEYVRKVTDHFPFIELQTNGFLLNTPKYEQYLQAWYLKGMTTVAISIVHHGDTLNMKGMRPRPLAKPWNLVKTISLLHEIGFSVRISCILEKGYTDSWGEVADLIWFCHKNFVEQLSIRNVEMPSDPTNKKVADYVYLHKLEPDTMTEIKNRLMKQGKELLHLVHGAVVFDYEGQNVCLTNCLTMSNDTEEVRQLIFFPDGHLRYDWVHPGAIIL